VTRAEEGARHPAGEGRAEERPVAQNAGGLARIRLVVLDVDGVLTDGRIVYGPGGVDDEHVQFHVRDGLGLVWLKQAGFHLAWITGRGCSATRARAKELGIGDYVERVPDKRAALLEVQERRGVGREETLVMGDDLPDLPMRGACAFLVAPADACDEVRARADVVTRAAGGRGAVRELCELLLRASGRWQGIVDAALR
jgi:3-deoxy-D-manno-octulosonate 8-phosphate phosphatase (KDO 8-P phosphatase)